MVRDGRQFDLVLQAETFGISGAKIHLEEGEDFDDDDRIDAIRTLSQTVDDLFYVFCDRRSRPRQWQEVAQGISGWLRHSDSPAKAAA